MCAGACTLPSVLAPVQPRAEPALDLRRHLTRVGVALQRLFAEDELAIEGHLEAALRTARELNPPQDRGPAAEQLVRQAHGPVEIVSRDAELDPYLVLGVDHQPNVLRLRGLYSWRPNGGRLNDENQAVSASVPDSWAG